MTTIENMVCPNESKEQAESAGAVVRAPLGTNAPLIGKDDEEFPPHFLSGSPKMRAYANNNGYKDQNKTI